MVADSSDSLLRNCVVKLSVPGKVDYGTGFFVAPGLILTCAHVVGNIETLEFCRDEIDVRWKDTEKFAKARVKPDKWFPDNNDIALLEISSSHIETLPCVYFHTFLEIGDDLYSFGYPDQDFSNGEPVTFKYSGRTGDNPPLIRVKDDRIRPGMSGAPIFNLRTGAVCGILKFTLNRNNQIGGGGIPATTILTQFKELKPGNVIRDLSDKVRKNIADILEDRRIEVFKDFLVDILEAEKKTIARTAEDIAAKLVEIEILGTLPLLYRAREKTVVEIEKQGKGGDAIQRVLTRTQDVIGWLVLLAVNTAWILENENAGTLRPESFPGAIELPVKTETGIEIIHAALNKRCAKFDIAKGTLFGAMRMPVIGHKFPEAGFPTKDVVSEIKKSIYAYISRGWGKEIVPGEITPDLNEEINAQLQWWNELNEARYLVVERSECSRSHPLNDGKVYSVLLKDLPDLRVIFHNTGTQSAVFRISEISLSTKLRNFFKHNHN